MADIKELVSELADELEAYYSHEFSFREDYPHIMRKYKNSMKLIEKARAFVSEEH